MLKTGKTKAVQKIYDTYQVIQAVTFSSPNVGGHQEPLISDHDFTIPKRSRSQHCQLTVWDLPWTWFFFKGDLLRMGFAWEIISLSFAKKNIVGSRDYIFWNFFQASNMQIQVMEMEHMPLLFGCGLRKKDASGNWRFGLGSFSLFVGWIFFAGHEFSFDRSPRGETRATGADWGDWGGGGYVTMSFWLIFLCGDVNLYRTCS